MTTTLAIISHGYARAEKLMREGWHVVWGNCQHRMDFTATKPAPPECPLRWSGDPEWCPSCGGACHDRR